jgi:hypothetical protein
MLKFWGKDNEMAITQKVLAKLAQRVDYAEFGEKKKIIQKGMQVTGLNRATFLPFK